jgi:diadenosine tetraphosphate (Ap4A) HIT family hydrolase
MKDRQPFDFDFYIAKIQSSPCFICEMVAGHLQGNYIVQQTDDFIIFLNKYPVLYGYVLVAPTRHKEQVTSDVSLDEYLALQKILYRTAEAVRKVTSPERVYILSLGSQQGNSHVHWHIAPLPSGIPFREQQLEALRVENGILDSSENEMKNLARQIRESMDGAD